MIRILNATASIKSSECRSKCWKKGQPWKVEPGGKKGRTNMKERREATQWAGILGGDQDAKNELPGLEFLLDSGDTLTAWVVNLGRAPSVVWIDG